MKHAMIAPNERIGWQAIRRMSQDYKFFEVIDTHDNYAEVRLPSGRMDTFYVVTREDHIRGKGVNGLILRAQKTFGTDELWHFAKRISLFRNKLQDDVQIQDWHMATENDLDGFDAWNYPITDICWRTIVEKDGEEIIRRNRTPKHRSPNP